MQLRTAATQTTKTRPLLLPGRLAFSAASTSLDPHSFISRALKVAAKLGLLLQGKQVHAHVIKLGSCRVLSLQNQILNVYVRCKELNDAGSLFDEMRVRNVVTWNTVICGLVNRGNGYGSSLYLGFSYLKRMLWDKAGFDAITFNGLLRGCVELNDIEIGRQVHCFIVKCGFELDSFVNTALVDLYGKCGLVNEARSIFDKGLCRDLVLWNVMVSCYALNCLAEEAFRVFNLMWRENLRGDGFTFSSLLNSCGTLGSCELGKQIHSLVIKLSFDLDVLVASGLVDMYAKGEKIEDARRAFDGMDARNVVSWNTIVVGYGQRGDWKEALKLLKKMFREDFAPDELTLASILSSCGSASASYEVMQVHAYVVKTEFQAYLSTANALINAYSKCGSIPSALHCFSLVPQPDIVTWTSLIGAYAIHSPKDSIDVFEKMLSSGRMPDQVAFLGVISACSHAGLVTKGLHYFRLMTEKYRILPDIEHYTCIIDLLGRAGLLDEAFNLLTSMPIGHGSAHALAAFIGACKVHGDVKLAKWAAEKLLALEPYESVNYALLSSMYAYKGLWSDVERVRQQMAVQCDDKVPGYSWMVPAG